MTEYHKSIIFSKTPLEGYFRYRNIFQIYPAALKKMPKSDSQKHHPIVLEYTITENDKIIPSTNFEGLVKLGITTATIFTKEEKIISLLTLITNHEFFKYEDLSGSWGVSIQRDDAEVEEVNKWAATWNMLGFHWPEKPAQLKINEFSELEVKEVSFVKHLKYFHDNPNMDFSRKNKVITFPDSCIPCLDSYFSRDKEVQLIINDAIAHSVNSIELKPLKKTLSIIAAFTAIETMVNLEFRNGKATSCQKCGQPEFKISKKIKDFLLKYMGESLANERKFSKFYSLRSKLVHSGQLLKIENLWNDLPEDEQEKETIEYIEILQLGKLSIIHWLIKKNEIRNFPLPA